MSTKNDLSRMLTDWPFDPTTVTARFVDTRIETSAGESADAGEEKVETREVQLRLDLGILQMKLDGRPDGARPHDHDSALDHYRRKMVTDRRAGPSLDGDACAELQQECVQFYYRYLALSVLKDYERVIRDTSHSLSIFELVETYADSEDLVWEFVQFKPYVYMMHGRAKGEKLAMEGRIDEAVEEIESAMKSIKAFMEDMEEDEDLPLEDCLELSMLADLIKDFRERRTEDNPVVKLKQKLQYAVHMENFEEAARLRDKIKAMETDTSDVAACSLGRA